MSVLALVVVASLGAAQAADVGAPGARAQDVGLERKRPKALDARRQEHYRPLDWAEVAHGQAAPGPVRVTGRFLAFSEAEPTVQGVLTSASGKYALRVEGDPVDWAPRAGEAVELWGQLERDATARALLLRVHDGRRQGDTRRQPQPPEARTQLWLTVVQSGSNPRPLNTGTTDEGHAYLLPRSYRGPWGQRVCLEGTPGSMGRMRTLKDVRPCP